MTLRTLLSAVLILIATADAHSQAPPTATSALNKCHGQRRDMVLFSGAPFVRVSVGGQQGYFLLDWATTRSVIDIITFSQPPSPTFRDGKSYFKSFDYFDSPMPEAQLSMQYLTYIDLKDDAGKKVIESGILGTDLLNYAFTLDFRGPQKSVHRQFSNKVCTDEILRSEGFLPVSTAGFFAYPNLATDDPDEPMPVLTVPLRIGGAWSPAQVDTGYGDSNNPHSINFNQAYLQELRAHGVRLHPKIATGANGQLGRVVSVLSTCVPDVFETTTEYVLDDETPAEIMGTDGKPVRSVDKLNLYLKESPARAKSCGGIGTWQKPGAQLGASFAIENDAVFVDAYSSRLWIRPQGSVVAH